MGKFNTRSEKEKLKLLEEIHQILNDESLSISQKATKCILIGYDFIDLQLVDEWEQSINGIEQKAVIDLYANVLECIACLDFGGNDVDVEHILANNGCDKEKVISLIKKYTSKSKVDEKDIQKEVPYRVRKLVDSDDLTREERVEYCNAVAYKFMDEIQAKKWEDEICKEVKEYADVDKYSLVLECIVCLKDGGSRKDVECILDQISWQSIAHKLRIREILDRYQEPMGKVSEFQ